MSARLFAAWIVSMFVLLLALLGITIINPPGAHAATDTKMYVTGYSYYDNDPPGYAIAYPKSDGYPTLHNGASGVGTYSNPITLAVGIVNGASQYKPGTRFYIPALRRYFLVEDSCADCGRGSNGYRWIDAWVDGHTSTVSNADNCMNKITGIHRVIINPVNGYSVPTAGPISQNNYCIALHTDTLVWGVNT